MRKFDYSFLENGMLPAGLFNLAEGIYSLRAASLGRKEKHVAVFSELEAIAKVQSVKSSNAIEGIVTSDERILEIVNRNSAPLNHDEMEISGYRDALNAVHRGYGYLDFRQSDILGLHALMFRMSDSPVGGHYKLDDNLIIQVDGQGRRSVRFRPVPASETPETMEQLELAYADARDNPGINHLLLIPCVILDFLCVHPFSDGNGRLSRLLSLLLLYRNGFDAGKYISFEEQINLYKTQYYEALKASSDGWNDNANDYFPFVRNFLSTLYMCYKELDKRFAVVGGRRVNKKNRIEATLLGSLTAMSKSEICAIHPDISPSTVEAALADMLKKKKIIKIGAGRATGYIRA